MGRRWVETGPIHYLCLHPSGLGHSTGIAGQRLLNDLKSQPNALKEHGFDEYSIWTGDQHTTVELVEQSKNGYLIQHQVRRESLEHTGCC